MAVRLKYGQLLPEGLAQMKALEHYLNTGLSLPQALKELVRLRCSQMNGCEFCTGLHTAELRRLNETEERIAAVDEWRLSELGARVFTERERAALAWAEAVTNIQDGFAPDEIYQQVRKYFSPTETVELTLVITTINAWNRLSVSLGNHSDHAPDSEAVLQGSAI